MPSVGRSVERIRIYPKKSGSGLCDATRIVDDLECFDRVRMAELLRLFQPKDLLDLLETVDRAVCGELSSIQDAYEGGDRESLTESFHKIRGMAGNYGLDPLAEIAGDLERILNDDASADIGEDLDRFVSHAKEACREIAYLMETL